MQVAGRNDLSMRIVVVTFGTEGDSRPMIALCHGLHAAGHDVALLAERSAESYSRALGVPFEPLAGDMAAALHSAADGLLRKGADASHVARVLANIAKDNTAAWMRVVLKHAESADAIVCAGLAVYVGLSCAEHLRIAVVGAALQPVMPTREFPSPFVRQGRFPGWVNRASHRLVLTMMWRAFRGAINAARAEVTGQPPRRAEWSGYPIVFGISQALVPRPRDWPERFSTVGYLWPPRDPAWQPDASLLRFLAEGDSPVYVGFGSMLGFDRYRLLAAVVEALDGRRALVFEGWSGFGAGALADNLHRIGPTPHDWLFPQVSMVVHHGGAGTTHSAARAGVPSAVVPFAGDQFLWADRLYRAGIAPRSFSIGNLTAQRLRAQLMQASDPAMRERARAIGAAMHDEKGVTNAVAEIDRLGAAGWNAR
jgi:sterol 3beta-glucosyltransferase